MSDYCFHSLGYSCFYSEGTNLLSYLDDCFRGFIDNEYEEYSIPAIIDEDVLEKCGYFHSFPQHITIPTYIDQQYHRLVANNGIIEQQQLRIGKKYLTPAACLHIYPMLTKIRPFNHKTITTKARVYRFEESGFSEVRLWDFTVREIVFVGDRNYVHQSLKDIQDKALQFAQNISSDATLSSASDSFYPNKQNIAMSRIQRVNSFKIELIIPIKNKFVAVSSFNFHDCHFSRAFGFDDNGQIVTGCVGFGLERWVEASVANNSLVEHFVKDS